MEDFRNNTPKLSFLNEELISFKTVPSVDVLKKKVDECRNSNNILSEYDLSNLEDISCVCFDNLTLENIVFSRFNPKSQKKTNLFQLSFKNATLKNISIAQAYLQQCNFDAANLECVDFFFSELEFCRFRQAEASYMDFRYSQICDCSLGEFKVNTGDFYYCNFLGSTSFIDSTFSYCSFTNSVFEHACIRMDNIKNGIVQDYSDYYHNIFLYNEKLNWNRYNPCFTINSMNKYTLENKDKSEMFVAAESMNFYRQISGIYAGKGLNRDSNEAYRKKIIAERKYCKKKLVVLKKTVNYDDCSEMHEIWYYRWRYYKTFLTQSLGFGYKWWPPCLWFLGLVIFFWLIIQFVSFSVHSHAPEWIQNLGYSLSNSLGPCQEYYKVVNMFVSCLQSTLGILLVGFCGFVVANKIRNDS